MKNLMIATVMGMAFFVTLSGQTAQAASRYPVYAYDVNYSYHIHRGPKLYIASGRYRSTFNRNDANRIAAWLRATYAKSHMRAHVSQRFVRWSTNR